jgi:hypothetical protein
MFRHQKEGQNHDIQVASKSLEMQQRSILEKGSTARKQVYLHRTFCLPASYLKSKHYSTHNYNVTCCFYGCKTWIFIIREALNTSLSDQGTEEFIWAYGTEATGGWRKLHHEEPHNL